MPDPTDVPLTAESRGEAKPANRLGGKRVLVVGAGQRVVDAATDPTGNGRAMARLFAREGATVAVVDVNADSALETQKLIEQEGGTAVTIVADVSSPAAVEQMVKSAADQLGGLDAAVYNVGTGPGGMGLDKAPDDWDAVMAVNLRGAMLTARAALPRLSDGGALVFISSVAGLKPGSRMPAYDASKAALGGLMRHTAREGARRGIRCNIVAPGLIDTPLGRVATQGRPSRGKTPVPLGRQGTGWEIAHAALFLVSGESAYITGQTLVVDGGLTTLS